MKKLFLSFAVVAYCASASDAIVSPGTEWEVMSTATANNLNGGGYDAAYGGVDLSRSDAAALVINDAVLGAGGNTVSSALTPLVAGTHEGNVIKISAGAGCNTTGPNARTVITSIDGSGVATLFSSLGTAASVCQARVGGALSLNSTDDDDFFETVAASNTVWVKLGDYSFGETVNVATDAFITLPADIIGYNTVRGELMGTSLPHFDMGATALTIAGNSFNLRNLSFTGTSTTGLNTGQPSTHFNIRVTNTSATASRVALSPSAQARIFRSEFSSLNGTAINVGNNANLAIAGNYIHHSSFGIINSNSSANEIIVDNVFYNYSSTAVYFSNATGPLFFIAGNTFVSTPTGQVGTAIHVQGNPIAATRNIAYNNIFTNNRVGINMRYGSPSGWNNDIFTRNNFFNNLVHVSSTVNIGDRNFTLDPQFVDINSGDLRVGANMQNLAIPSGFGTSASTSSLKLGAVQTDIQTGGGSGGTRSYSFTQ